MPLSKFATRRRRCRLKNCRDCSSGSTGATKRGPGGSGLGLPIARDLIELHGGTLAASLSGGEIVFTIRLPRRSGDIEPDGA